MAASNYCQKSFRVDSFLDAEPLCLSTNGGLDDFDLDILEEEEDNERPFDDSKSSPDLDELLSDSNVLTAVDFRFELLENSVNDVRDDTTQEIDQTSSRRGSCRRTGRSRLRDRSPSPQARSPRQRSQMKAVDFDPPSPQRQQHPFDQHQQRRTSHGDASTCSYATAQSFTAAQPVSESQFNEALRKLEESMMRTWESRIHVMEQRYMLALPQQHAFSSANEQLNRRQRRVRRRVAVPQAANAQGRPTTPRSLSPGRSSVVAAFFSGSRATLTDGLEQSRKQLIAYMGSENNHTMSVGVGV